MTCASCVNTITRCVSDLPGVSEVAVSLLGNSATVVVDDKSRVDAVVEAIEDAGYEAEVVSVQSDAETKTHRVEEQSRNNFDGPFHLVLSVGGMTCSSCTTTITTLANETPGVSQIAVSLIGKSATAVIERKDTADQLAQAIEDAGYEVEIVSIEPVEGKKDQQDELRVVDIHVEGMFCPHCPDKVMALLGPIASHVTVLKPLTTHTDPLLTLEYVPSPPEFTIRTILDVFSRPQSEADSSSPLHPFVAHLYHPPTLEQRARRMHAREQRDMLMRLLFSVIVAIPTFIIGVVYMSLVGHTNKTRMWFMRPLWTGNASRMEWALFFLATPVMFYSAGTFHRRSLKEIWALWKPGSRVPYWQRFTRFGSMNLLVSTGVSVAYFSSIALLALAGSQPASDTGEGDTTTYFDSVVFLAMFLLAGRFLEAYSKARTADAVTALGKLRPTEALLVINTSHKELSPTLSTSSDLDKGSSSSSHTALGSSGQSSIVRVSPDLLEVGDIVRVLHGSSPPADGTLVTVSENLASFDESSLTGESRAVKKDVGDQVFVGTINRGAVVDIRVDAIGGQTMLDHVVKVVREGQTRRAPIERVADLITGYFVPVVTVLAIVTWVVWLSLGLSGALPSDYLDIPVGGWVVWSLEFAIAVFVVACPCGIGLAAPTALLVGSGLAAKSGILVRGGGEAFQEAAQLDLVVFDKTGTLTEGGDPRVVDSEILPEEQTPTEWTKEVILGVAAELEAGSSHPLALAIRRFGAEQAAKAQKATEVQETAGRGLKAEFGELGCQAIIGNEAWMSEHGAKLTGQLETRLAGWKAEGNSVVLLALRKNAATKRQEDISEGDDGAFQTCALFSIADALRSEAMGVVAALQSRGVGTWMISGDNVVTAKAVARKVGIPETSVIAGVLPHEKAEKVRWLQQVGMKRTSRGLRLTGHRLNSRCIVAMVGDGINDAPALSAADVGIAIGSGSDVAISSASFILVSSQLNSLLTLIDLSRKVFNRVKFNFLWATIYNLIALPIAAGVIYPAHGHPRLAPVWASLAMALSSVSVVCSSLLLKTFKEPRKQFILLTKHL
ncbi:heavy metal translocatin [Irpex rosettiformis]|uniref:Heavy metal translocatin n=1 Tax=Irpex rosettiformis TaxID=378272 RepID=A0ACB8UEM9_9APHY|nr:heavy metal translocatin [Irpex rosettiformis]